MKPLDVYPPFEAVTRCEPLYGDAVKRQRPGIAAFRELVLDEFGGSDLGVGRECPSGMASSTHHESRGWDWGPSPGEQLADWQARAALLIAQLTDSGPAGPHELARRMGIRNIIFDRVIRGARHEYAARPYDGENDHTTHVHFDWSWAGAKASTSGYDKRGGAAIVLLPFPRNGGDHELGNVETEAKKVIGTVADVRGMGSTSQAFRRELLAVAERLGVNADELAAVISFETGGTFSPSVRNPHSGAVGLIQFMRGTAERLGTTQDELARLTATAQLAYVEQYLEPASGQLADVADLYMAVFAPKGIGKPLDFPLYSRPSIAYDQNAGLDRDKDGVISKGEAADHVIELLADSRRKPRLPVEGRGPMVVATAALLSVSGLALWLSRR